MFPSILTLPSRITLQTENDTTEFNGANEITKEDLKLTIRENKIRLKADRTPVKNIVLRWNVKMPEKARFCGDHWERGYGDLEWRGFVPHRVMPWYFYAYDCKEFALYGVKVRPDAFCSFRCDPGGITLTLDVSCGVDGTVLAGREILCAELVFSKTDTDDPFSAAVESTKLLADGAVFPSAPVYGYNNWYYAYGTSSEQEIFAAARELAQFTAGIQNRPFMVIDDCWQKERPTDFIGGDWRRSNERFPDMKALAQKIREIDVLPGIWMRPLQNKADYIPSCLYRDQEEFLLDPSMDETLEIVAEDIRTLTGWGYRLIKHDYSTCDIVGDWGFCRTEPLCQNDVHFANRSMTTAEIIKRLYKTIYDAADGNALILGCNTVGHLGVGYMELNRTGDDTSGREWERTRKMGVNTLAFRMPQHNAFYAADADCVGITSAVPWDKNRQWLDLLANSGTPLFISVAPGSLSPEQKKDLQKALRTAAYPQPAGIPLDWLDTCCPEQWKFGDCEKAYDWY